MSLIVTALAAYRLVRAWFWEEIGEKPRQAAEEWLSQPVVVEGEVWVEETYVKGWLYKLITCPYCLGFWICLGVVVARRVPFARRVVDALAAATIVAVALDWYPDKAHEAADEFDENEPPNPEDPVTEQVADTIDNARRAEA